MVLHQTPRTEYKLVLDETEVQLIDAVLSMAVLPIAWPKQDMCCLQQLADKIQWQKSQQNLCYSK